MKLKISFNIGNMSFSCYFKGNFFIKISDKPLLQSNIMNTNIIFMKQKVGAYISMVLNNYQINAYNSTSNEFYNISRPIHQNSVNKL